MNVARLTKKGKFSDRTRNRDSTVARVAEVAGLAGDK